MRNMYQSSLRQLKRQRSITDIRTINFARETFFRGGTPPTEITIIDDLEEKLTKVWEIWYCMKYGIKATD